MISKTQSINIMYVIKKYKADNIVIQPFLFRERAIIFTIKISLQYRKCNWLY